MAHHKAQDMSGQSGSSPQQTRQWFLHMHGSKPAERVFRNSAQFRMRLRVMGDCPELAKWPAGMSGNQAINGCSIPTRSQLVD